VLGEKIMAMVINTNIMSLTSQRSLSNSQSALSTSMERLSTGLRINSAKDDAAGLGIADRMSTQIRGLNQAMRNANDGISLSQTAEGALSESSNILQRMRELAIQSANDSNSDTDRANLQKEVAQLQEELTRIAETTTFNGRNVLDGTLGTFNLQVGANAYETISVDFGSQDFSANKLGSSGGDIVGSAATGTLLGDLITATADGMTINGVSLTDLTGTTTLQDAIDSINNDISGVEAGAYTEALGSTAPTATGVIDDTTGLILTLTNADGGTNTIEIRNTGSMEELAAKINDEADGLLSADVNNDGALVVTSDTGATIAVTANAAATAAGLTGSYQAGLTLTKTDTSIEEIEVGYTTAANGADVGILARADGSMTGVNAVTDTDTAAGDLIINGVEIGAVEAQGSAAATATALANAINEANAGVIATDDGAGVLTLHSVGGDAIAIENGNGAVTAAAFETKFGFIESNAAESTGMSIANIDISTEDGAQRALNSIDAALQTISDTRGDMGAVQNRLESTIANLGSVSENVSAARSRIQDADFAAETANLTRTQILQQAGVAMLSQANSQPQMVLSLLQ
jgi:flagellin